jgi:hypothetical protein
MPASPEHLDTHGSELSTITVGSVDLLHVQVSAAGNVIVRASTEDGAVLTAAEARRLAIALLETAELAEVIDTVDAVDAAD